MPRNKINSFEQGIRNDISNNLRDLIKQRGMSQRRLAEEADIPYTTISGYFNAKSTPNAGAVEKMSTALHVFKSDIDPRFKNKLPSGTMPVASEFIQIPLLGEIACGEPIIANQNIDGYIPTEKADLPAGVNFWLTCKGDSMAPTLPDGSKVLVHEQPEVEDGEMAAVLIDDEATLKRVKRVDGNKILLLPDNNSYEPILLDKNSHARILGKVIEMKMKF